MKSKLITCTVIAALLACSACSDQMTKTSLNQATVVQPQQFSTIQWDSATASGTMRQASNIGLIMMH